MNGNLLNAGIGSFYELFISDVYEAAHLNI